MKKKELKGSLLEILVDIEKLINNINITTAIIDNKSFKRKEIKPYPDPSLREMVLNAICHADYFIKSNIKIEIFKDKLIITNPGSIYNASLEDILNGVQTYRNPKLVRIFDKLHYIENYGTGIMRTIKAYNDFDLKPKFNPSDNFFKVELPNVTYNKQFDQINDQINEKISDLGLYILRLIKMRPGIKVPELVKIISQNNKTINSDTIRNKIRRELKNYIEYKGSNKTGGYYIK